MPKGLLVILHPCVGWRQVIVNGVQIRSCGTWRSSGAEAIRNTTTRKAPRGTLIRQGRLIRPCTTTLAEDPHLFICRADHRRGRHVSIRCLTTRVTLRPRTGSSTSRIRRLSRRATLQRKRRYTHPGNEIAVPVCSGTKTSKSYGRPQPNLSTTTTATR
jgi:hypothetical protein